MPFIDFTRWNEPASLGIPRHPSANNNPHRLIQLTVSYFVKVEANNPKVLSVTFKLSTSAKTPVAHGTLFLHVIINNNCTSTYIHTLQRKITSLGR